MLARRLFFWLFVVVMTGAPVLLMIATSKASSGPVSNWFIYNGITQCEFLCLAGWCIIFVRQEPFLVRVALVLLVLVSAGSLWFYKL